MGRKFEGGESCSLAFSIRKDIIQRKVVSKEALKHKRLVI